MWESNVGAINEMLQAVAQDQRDAAGAEVDETDQQRALRMLLSAQIDCEVLEMRGESPAYVTRRRTVYEAWSEAKKTSAREKDNSYARSLKRAGMMRIDHPGRALLFVSDNATLRAALKGTPWAAGQSIVGALARLPGAEMTTKRPRDTRPRIDGEHRSGVFIPLETADADGSKENAAAAGPDADDIEF